MKWIRPRPPGLSERACAWMRSASGSRPACSRQPIDTTLSYWRSMLRKSLLDRPWSASGAGTRSGASRARPASRWCCSRWPSRRNALRHEQEAAEAAADVDHVLAGRADLAPTWSSLPRCASSSVRMPSPSRRRCRASAGRRARAGRTPARARSGTPRCAWRGPSWCWSAGTRAPGSAAHERRVLVGAPPAMPAASALCRLPCRSTSPSK